MSISITTRRFTKFLGFGSLFTALSASAFALAEVTAAGFKEVQLGSSVKVINYLPNTDVNFANMSLNLNSVTTSAGMQSFSSTISIGSVNFRSVSPNTATNVAMRSVTQNSVQNGTFSSFTDLLGKGNNNTAVLNALVNAGDGSGYERIDVSFSSAHVVAANDVIVMFGMGMNQTTTSFLVAGMSGALSSGSNGKDAVYLDAGHLVSSQDFGQNLSGKTYYNAVFGGSDVSGSPTSWATTSLTTSGVVISLTDLGFAVGDTIYGFSIMGSDVKANSATDLADYSNSSVYLTGTGASAGGLDFTSFNVGSLSPVPEPSTYGAILTAGSLGFFAWRRRRQSRAA